MKKEIEPYILDDRCIISEEVKKMTKEERQKEIERLEMEGRKERDHLRRKKKLSTASA